jgi:beta-lactam-binding protein with PASTA domain
MMGLLALLAVFALVVIAAVVISDSTSSTVVHYQNIVARDAQSAVSQIQSLINQYTK